jgi:hypothetical protein
MDALLALSLPGSLTSTTNPLGSPTRRPNTPHPTNGRDKRKRNENRP